MSITVGLRGVRIASVVQIAIQPPGVVGRLIDRNRVRAVPVQR